MLEIAGKGRHQMRLASMASCKEKTVMAKPVGHWEGVGEAIVCDY
jgi:hypothetical protein